MIDGDVPMTMRVSFNCTPREYQEFNELKKLHGLKTNTIFTDLFHKVVKVMRVEKPLLDKVDV